MRQSPTSMPRNQRCLHTRVTDCLKETKTTTPFAAASRKIKHFGINVAKEGRQKPPEDSSPQPLKSHPDISVSPAVAPGVTSRDRLSQFPAHRVAVVTGW